MSLGLVLSTIGQEAVTGQLCFTFGIAEVLTVVEEIGTTPVPVRLREMMPNREEWRRSVAPCARGTLIGFVIGLLGLLGDVLRRFDFQLAPLVIGPVLGPMTEKHLREGLFMNFGGISTFYESPLAIGIWIIALLVLTIDLQRSLLARLFGLRFGAPPKSENE